MNFVFKGLWTQEGRKEIRGYVFDLPFDQSEYKTPDSAQDEETLLGFRTRLTKELETRSHDSYWYVPQTDLRAIAREFEFWAGDKYVGSPKVGTFSPSETIEVSDPPKVSFGDLDAMERQLRAEHQHGTLLIQVGTFRQGIVDKAFAEFSQNTTREVGSDTQILPSFTKVAPIVDQTRLFRILRT
jgi:hypothetical protein